MILSNAIDRPAGLPHLPATDQRDSLRVAFGELLGALDQLREGSTCIARSVKRWEGDGAVYPEVALPEIGAIEVDINVHEGHAFIRIEVPGIRPRPVDGSNCHKARRKSR
jgi:HSP20 family molecular chaperone IbpA